MAIGSFALGCGGGGADVGESCATVSDCASGLQCLDHICRPGCLANIDCGDGRVCEGHTCRLVESAVGDGCNAEADCGPGQSCRLAIDVFVAGDGTCEREADTGGVVGAACQTDTDCRVGACALGRCTELCEVDAECLRGFQCVGIPRVSSDASSFLGGYYGCLPSRATLAFDVPLRPQLSQPLIIPVVNTATSLVVVAEAAQADERIGVTAVTDPENQPIFTAPTTVSEYFAGALRHKPLPGVAVLQIPSTSAVALRAGVYAMTITSSADRPEVTLEGRRVRVVEKLGPGATLDLHFHFADLTDHPCLPPERLLGPLSAPSDPDFQAAYLGRLRAIFAAANIAVGTVTYEATSAPVELEGLASERASELFATADDDRGVSVFFVRTISPAGLEVVVGGTPGSPLPRTGASGVAIAATALCNNTDPSHRNEPAWDRLARTTAHAISRHLGLYRNREPEPEGAVDPLVDSPTSDDNLMYWGEDGGTALSTEQREILRASPVLR